MKIRVDDLMGIEIAQFLEEHITEMKQTSPPESKHALDLDDLRKPEVTFWTIWDEDFLAGCGALLELTGQHAEIKSMRTSSAARNRGVASKMLQHILSEARKMGYRRLSLETGTMPYFEPARTMYLKHGFNECPPFSSYVEDPNSVFLTVEL